MEMTASMLKKLAGTLCSIICFNIPSHAAAKSAFTVHHSLERNQLYDVLQREKWNEKIPFIISPDGSQLLVIIGNGISSESTYEFRLISFDLNQLYGFVKTKKPLPKPKVLATLRYDKNNPSTSGHHSAGIKSISFYGNGRYVAFIGHDNDSKGQVYSIDLYSGALRKLTNSSEGVLQYIINEAQGDVIFFEKSYKASTHCQKIDFIVGTQEFLELFCLDNGVGFYQNKFKTSFPHFFANILRTPIDSVDAPQILSRNAPIYLPISNFILSPDGAKAIFPLQSDNYEWKDAFDSGADALSISYDDDTMRKFVLATHYAILDLRSGNLDIIDDFPINLTTTPQPPQWLSSESVMLLGVKPVAPTVTSDMRLSEKSNNNTVDVVINFVDGKYHLYHATFPTTESSSRFIKDKTLDYAHSRPEKRSHYATCKEYEETIELELDNRVSCYLDIFDKGLRITTGESYKDQPNLYITDLSTGRNTLFYELNPQLKNYNFGNVEIFRWVDGRKRQWQAGLIYPVDYVSGRKYPLVVQTHGFDPNHYIFDGPPNLTAPYAGQALANRGMFVLNVPDVKFDSAADEQPGTAAGISAAVKLLSAQGKVDISKVGLLGYSSTGSLVFNMAIFPDFVPAAVIVSDAYSQSEMGYASMYAMPGLGMAGMELLFCGAKPWGETAHAWMERNPLHNVDRLRTPVRIEDHHGVPTGWWDIYVALRRLHAPVEYVMFTTGKHPSQHPTAVYKSQQATVDWFDFWLNNPTSTDPSIAGQYKRWTELKEKLVKLQQPLRPYTPLSQQGCENNSQPNE